MARFSVACAVVNGRPTTVGCTLDILNAGTTPADSQAVTDDAVAVDDAVDVLVADGASPTEAHVTTLAAAWAVLAASIAALQAGVSPGDAAGMTDVIVSFDAATVITRTALRQAVNALLVAVDGSNSLTP